MMTTAGMESATRSPIPNSLLTMGGANTMTLTETTTRTLEVPGATLTYDVRPGGSPDATPLFLIGSPMAAAGFGTLAGHFTDRTVVTYDPAEASEAS